MRLRNYKNYLHEQLQDQEAAALYLEEALSSGSEAEFLIALKDVVEAAGGVGALAGHVNLKRPSLYKILCKTGNPRLKTLQEILKPLGLRISIVSNKAA